MKLTFKKEVKHSVVYEATEEKSLIRSVYLMKAEFSKVSAEYASEGTYPREIEITVTAP